MNELQKIDLSFRPETYWPDSLSQEMLISRIKGKARQEIARGILRREGFTRLPDFLARAELTDEQRDVWGRMHPGFMGGEFLPNLEDGEVEIVRISLESTTNDQISIRARKTNGKIRYRAASEHDEDEAMRYVLPFDESQDPLTLAELITFIDGCYIPDDIFLGGLVFANWECGYDDERNPDKAIRFVTIESPFYPDLAKYYSNQAVEWRKSHPSPDEEE